MLGPLKPYPLFVGSKETDVSTLSISPMNVKFPSQTQGLG